MANLALGHLRIGVLWLAVWVMVVVTQCQQLEMGFRHGDTGLRIAQVWAEYDILDGYANPDPVPDLPPTVILRRCFVRQIGYQTDPKNFPVELWHGQVGGWHPLAWELYEYVEWRLGEIFWRK